jgi:hypothetical protein
MESDRRVDEVAAQRTQPRERALFGAGEPAIADNIRDQDRREFPSLAHCAPLGSPDAPAGSVKLRLINGWAGRPLSMDMRPEGGIGGLKRGLRARRATAGDANEYERGDKHMKRWMSSNLPAITVPPVLATVGAKSTPVCNHFGEDQGKTRYASRPPDRTAAFQAGRAERSGLGAIGVNAMIKELWNVGLN